jgi:hypothetical protein
MRPDPERPPAGSRRRTYARVLLIVFAALLVAGLAAQPALAQNTPTTTTAPSADCTNSASPLQTAVCQQQGTAGQAGQAATSAAQGVVTSAGDSALRALASAVAASGGWVLEKVGGAITHTTSPNVNAGWFVNQYQVMLALGLLVTLPMLLFSIVQAMLKGDMSHILRSAFVYLPVAAIFSFVGPAFIQLLIALSDWMALAASANAAADAQKFMTETGQALLTLGLGTATPGVPVFAVLLGALLVLVGGFSIWVELLLRSAAIYAGVMFLPLAFAAMVWPSAWKVAKKVIEFLIAIIFAKVLIVAIVALAASGLANSGFGDGFEGVLAGAAMLLLAAASPAALLKLIPIAEAGISEASNQRQALRRATYAGSLISGSQVVQGMIQSRFRTNTALPTAAAAGAGAAGGAAAAVAAQARAGTTAMRNRATTALDNAPGKPAGAAPAAPPPSAARPAPSGGGTASPSPRSAQPGDQPFGRDT